MIKFDFRLLAVLILLPRATFAHGESALLFLGVNAIVLLFTWYIISKVRLATKGKLLLWGSYVLTIATLFLTFQNRPAFETVDRYNSLSAIALPLALLLTYVVIRRRFRQTRE